MNGKNCQAGYNRYLKNKEKPTASEVSELVQNCNVQNIALALEELETGHAIETFKAIPSSLSP